ncbi:hypothetical protein IE981_30605 [Klebsiella pneumoniae]|nr:hypothetical protein [Klebsiella pneumoniae]
MASEPQIRIFWPDTNMISFMTSPGEPECNSRSQNNLGVGGTLFARVEGVWESRPRTFLDYLIQLLVDPIHVTWGDSEPERTFKVFHATFLAEHNEFSILVSGYGMDGE